ncbi:MAG: hypothetical protein HN509_02050 [Halobacteriovoraceae bacterium]|jgi:hypothetical protein|nr:hypothetical protein [Halobacteriovoraceae bacterium]
MKILLRIFFFFWELFQNILGACFLLSFYLRGNIKKSYYEKERFFVEIRSIGAISLGMFVFYTEVDNSYVPVGLENKDHEYGHSVQSRRATLPAYGRAHIRGQIALCILF